jgi:hypothetical protein
MSGLGDLLGLATVTLEALLRMVAAALSGFRLFFGISFSRRHGDLLHTVIISRRGMKETLSHSLSAGKPQSEHATPTPQGVYISPL